MFWFLNISQLGFMIALLSLLNMFIKWWRIELSSSIYCKLISIYCTICKMNQVILHYITIVSLHIQAATIGSAPQCFILTFNRSFLIFLSSNIKSEYRLLLYNFIQKNILLIFYIPCTSTKHRNTSKIKISFYPISVSFTLCKSLLEHFHNKLKN